MGHLKILGLFFLLLIPSLTPLKADEVNRFFQREISYVSKLVSDDQCQSIRARHILFNCSRQISFKPNGTATMILTDIVNVATYEIKEEGKVVVTLSGAGDAPPVMTFRMDLDQKVLVDEKDLRIWLREDLHRLGN